MRIAFLTHRLPYAPNRGDRIRAYHELRILASRHEVHLVSLVHDREEESHASDLRALAASVSTAFVPRVQGYLRGLGALATAAPLTHALLHSPAVRPALEALVQTHRPDLVLAYCSSMARFALGPPLHDRPFILDMVDVDSEKWSTMARTSRPPTRWVYAREARCLARFEAAATRRSRVTYVVNTREAASLRDVAGPEAQIEVLQNGVDVEYLRPRRSASRSADVVFCGVMNYPPNEEAALWMARDAWPKVRAARSDARLVLLGASPTKRLRALPDLDPSIAVTGAVPDVRPYLWEAAVSVAPLLMARGVQSKVLEAVAAGLPAVVTPVVADGLPVEVMPACRVAASPDALAQNVLDLLAAAPHERRAIAATARLEHLGWEQQLQPLLNQIERLQAARKV